MRQSGPEGFDPSICGSEDRSLYLPYANCELASLPHLRASSMDSLAFDISKDGFREWLQSQGKTKATIRETINCAKRFTCILDTGDASPLLTLSPRNKQHAMTALANLAKYQGQYDQFLQIRQRYNLKWSKGDSIQHFNRFFNEGLSLDVMLQRIKEMIAKT
jgi:hypothetical protein